MRKYMRAATVTTALVSLIFFMVVCIVWVNESFTSVARKDMNSLLRATIYLSEELPEDFNDYAQKLARSFSSNIRVTVIDKDGVVVGDSMGESAVMENHGQRKEILEAKKTGYGENLRESATIKTRTLYVARPWKDGYILRLGMVFSPAFDFVRAVLPGFIISFFLSIVVALYISAKITKKTTGAIQLFTDMLTNSIEPARNSKDMNLSDFTVFEEFVPIMKKYQVLLDQNNEQFKEVMEKQDEINRIISEMGEGLILIDNDFNILMANGEGLNVFGIRNIEIEKNLLHLYREEKISKLLKNVLTTGARRTIDITGKTGDAYRIHVSSVKGHGLVVLATDITPIIRLENIRRDFSSNVSHELKTPLTTISGFAELISTGMVSDTDKINEYAAKIHKQSLHLIELIEDLLKISEIENNPVKADEITSGRAVFEIAGEMLTGKIAEKGIDLTISGEAAFNLKYNHMLELALNLLDNAVKYNGQNGSVCVNLFDNNTDIGFSVKDTGCGIDENEQQRVFERFYRVDKGRNSKVSGTGLGLAIVKHVVLAYDGEIKLTSDKNGTNITITFKKPH